MAITGIDTIDGKQIIAAGAQSATNAYKAELTTGGNSIQGLYDFVSTSSGSWSGSEYSAGTGIDITDDVISVTSEYVPFLTITNNKNTSQVTCGDLKALAYGTKKFNLYYRTETGDFYYVSRAKRVGSHFELIFSTPNTNQQYETNDLQYCKYRQYITMFIFEDEPDDKVIWVGGGADFITVNVQPNWNETNTQSESYIQNKPDIPTVQLNEDNQVSSINNYPLAGGGSLPASADEACQVVTANSADWNEVSAKADTSGVIDFFDKPTAHGLVNVWASGGKLHAYIAEATNLYASGDTANFTIISPTSIYTKSGNENTLDIEKLTAVKIGFTAAGISAYTDSSYGGLTANGLTAGPNASFAIQGKGESLTASYGAGFVFSSVNTGIGTARLTYASPNASVQIYSPKFEAKNISGAGFSIEGSGAKGYDQNGNVVWDTTKPAKLIGWNNYQGTAIDTRAAGINGGIIATVYPDNIPTAMTISSAPYAYMNGYGFYAINPSNSTKLSVDTLQSRISLEFSGMSSTAIMNPGDVYYRKYNNDTSATDVWSLTGSVQKYELEGDSAVSSISAIAGSALYCPLASLNTEGITDIQLVNELPVDPVSTVLYLIPEA